MKLYEIEASINEAINKLLESVDEETGEVSEDATRELEDLQEQRETKLENIACYIKNLNADIVAIKTEEDTLKKRRKALENKAQRLSEFLGMHISTDEKISTARVVVSFRRSKRVDIIDEELIPAKFCEMVYETKIDKNGIAKAIKEGEVVGGCELIDTYSLQIK